jgi:hypothetical protein
MTCKKRYDFGCGISIVPRMEPDGIVKASDEWDAEVTYCRVFDIFRMGKHVATAETYDQAKGMVFSLLVDGRHQFD